jgi:lysophospholipase L1-like esterase
MNKLIIYGDSLSTGTHGNGGYLQALRDAFQPAVLLNRSIGSSGCAACTPDSMMQILSRDDPDACNADLIFVWHGTNDWYWGTPFGPDGLEDPNTWQGSIARAVQILRRLSPHALLVWATPLYRFECPDTGNISGDAAFLKNKVGYTQLDYTAALRVQADLWHFPVIETGRLCGINAQTDSELLEDHVHPNASGYRHIQRVLCAELKQLWYYHTGEVLQDPAHR